MSSVCYSSYLHLRKVQQGIRTDLFVPARCKSWGCEYCRRVKANVVQNFIRKSFDSQQLYMLTFTDPHKGLALDAWKTLGDRWNLFRTWATKHYGKFQYVRVIEPHVKGGWPHMHVLLDVKMSSPEIRTMLKQWGFGFVFDITEMTAGVGAAYVSKYLTKEWPGELANTYRRQSGARIVQASQSLGPIFQHKSEWKMVSHKVNTEELKSVVTDLYFNVWINSDWGARLLKNRDTFEIRSKATPSDVLAFSSLVDIGRRVMSSDLAEYENKPPAIEIDLFAAQANGAFPAPQTAANAQRPVSRCENAQHQPFVSLATIRGSSKASPAFGLAPR